MAPYPKITTYPPLGQLTIIPPGQERIQFTLIIEWNLARPAYPFELCLAYSVAGTGQHESQWKRIPLKRSSDKGPYILDAEDCRRTTYRGTLGRQDLKSSFTNHCLFTVTFRVDAQAPRQWVSVLDGTAPGELLLQSPLDASLNNQGSLQDNLKLTDHWTIKPTPSSSNTLSTKTYLLESKAPIPTSQSSDNDTDADLTTLPLGTVPTSIRYFSVVRLEPYWLGPRQGIGKFFYISEDAITTSFLLDNGLIVTLVVVGWCDDVYQVLRSDEHGGITIAARNDHQEGSQHYRVVASVGLDFNETMTSAMEVVRDVVSASMKIPELTNALSSTGIHASLPSADSTTTTTNSTWLDSVSFCTWNALGQNLSEPLLLDALTQLRKHEIHISTLLIDDNWQTLGPIPGHDYSDSFNRGWADMEANKSIAPTGLKDLISSIRTQHPYIQDIGVWHALMGYWGGISPSGQIAATYQTTTVPALLMGNVPAEITSISANDLHRFYDDFYRFLGAAGITFVKTDVQHMLSMFRSAGSRRDLVSTYQSAWTGAHLKHFGGKAISCMSQTPQTLFHSLLQRNTPAVVHRNSDDFYPEVSASHPWHVWVNAHNAVFTKHLNAVLDWDMFQTDHEFSAYHAAARCVSGGPIMITDTPGVHDGELIAQMTARGLGGASVALRTEPGVAVDVFGLYTEQNVLKVKAETRCGGVVMAVFNISEKEARGLVHIGEFGVHEQDIDEVLIRSHRTEEILGPIVLSRSPDGQVAGVSEDEEEQAEMGRLMHIRLAARGWEILTAQPVHRVQVDTTKHMQICVLGLLGKMSGAAAITSSSITVEKTKVVVVVVGLKALGRLGVWFDGAVPKDKVHVSVAGTKVDEEFLKLVSLSSANQRGGCGNGDRVVGAKDGLVGEADQRDADTGVPHVWEVDVEAFWKDREMWDARLKEVMVEFVVSFSE